MSSRVLRGEATPAAAPPWLSNRPSAHRPEPVHQPDPDAVSAASQVRLAEQLSQARAAGVEEGERVARERLEAPLRRAAAEMAGAAAELARLKPAVRQEAEQDVVRLAVEIARRILQREITVDPDALLGIVKAALSKIEAREIHRIRIHPNHAAAVEAALREQSVRGALEVVPDASLGGSGIVFETARGDFDASVGTQLREIERGLLHLVQQR